MAQPDQRIKRMQINAMIVHWKSSQVIRALPELAPVGEGGFQIKDVA